MPESADPSRTARLRWLRAPSPWLAVPAAVVAGLLVFLAVWLAQRGAQEEHAATILPAVTVEPAPQGTPLPAPQPPEPAPDDRPEDAGGGVFVLPDAPADPPAGIAGAPASGTAPGPEAGFRDAAPGAAASAPVPTHTPAPTYPRSALRRGMSGEVVVRALVGADGQPRQLEVVRSSSHRALDQAALQAVRRWRFQPAMRGGQPVAQAVHVPIHFDP